MGKGKWKGEGGAEQGTMRNDVNRPETLKNLRRQRQTGPFYGSGSRGKRGGFGGRGRASGRKHRATRGWAQGVQLPG